MNGKNKKLLVYSIYPAPYRSELFDLLCKEFDIDIYYETSYGDYRDSNWFKYSKGTLIETKEGQEKYKKSLVNIKKYDLVILYENSSKNEVMLMLTCCINKVPFVLNSDGDMLIKHGNIIRECIKKYIIPKAKCCLASGENAKNYFLRYGAIEKSISLHHFSSLHECDILEEPITITRKNELRNMLNLPLDKKIVIAVGRFIKLKRYDSLIKSWKNMPDDYLLVLIGGGPEKQSYIEMMSKEKIDGIQIEDYKTKEELANYLQASDVFTHPTSYDVWGLVINEAMANGLPVVASDHCVACLELVKDGYNGFKVEMGDDEDMCNKIKKVCKDYDFVQMSSNSINTIKDYTIENMAKSQINTINKLLYE